MIKPADLKEDTVKEPLKIALLGCGVVGTQVARLLTQQTADIEARIGREIELVGIAVRDLDRPREGLDPALFTTDATALVSRDDLDVVIEVIGGIDPVHALVRAAIQHGASVVTANKALLAEHGPELAALAESEGVDLYFEAAVAGAIPIIRPLRESLVGDEITTVMGIVNGTTNFILDKMSSEGGSFADVLAEAQELGYAEADPTADIEGFDAAAKAAILASLAFHTHVRGSEVYREGITKLASDDIAAAQRMGFEVKLVAIAHLNQDDSVTVKVHPAMVPLDHPLAAVKGAYNAIFVESREAGRLMFLGPGAGGAPTASAVMGDLVTVARNRVRGVAGPAQTSYTQRKVAPMGASVTRYFMRFEVRDKPGILAAAAQIFAEHEVSVQTVQQSTIEALSRGDEISATLGMLTHAATEEQLRACVQELEASDFVPGAVRVLRVEGV
ncbi:MULTISPECIES: homoserine dehydrogenase [Aestuariimicrobium]|uniref:homoserine dehydrogenase n=1 Tax=Aestuariimicrobium TaxID=396388 RepID=UPI0003B7555F|nr:MULTISPECIES: homoserine dehydrogenase [Aestuariimicrobium]CAI9410474.1 Homoserine dehydrogenase [Aestuariimicrobium sp. T2.26MG-19.2B]